MSHYQDNINAPQFPPGVHMAHYSLANTTLIGQEVQQRLWEKYWGEQFPAQPAPYMWYHPGMCYHGYPYGVPATFHPASAHAGSDQSQHPVLSQRNIEKSSDDDVDNVNDILAEILGEGKIQQTNTQITSKQKQGLNSSSPKIVDPVTNNLNWNMFSTDLADGIAVSILDSFILELPLLDFTLVQSVLQDIDKNLPQPQVQQSTEKNEYFQDIAILPQTECQCNNDETHSDEAVHSDDSTVNVKELEHSSSLDTQDDTAKTDSSPSGLHTIGKTFPDEDFCSAEPVSSTDESKSSNISESETQAKCSSIDEQIEQLADPKENTL